MSGFARERLGQLGRQRLLVGIPLARGQVGAAQQVAQPREEPWLERRDGQVPGVGGGVDAVAGKPARDQARHGLAPDPIGHELVGAVGQRDRHMPAAAGSLPFQERGEDPSDRGQPSTGEVGNRHGRHRRSRVGE